VALGFLSAPLFVFVTFWSKTGWALIIGGGLLVLGVLAAQESKSELRTAEPRTSMWTSSLWRSVFWILLCLAITAFSGAGGFATQNGDWHKHSGIFLDLHREAWPLFDQYAEDGLGPRPLVYYLGFYLIPAAFSRGQSLVTMNLLIYLFTACGLFLAVREISRHAHLKYWWLPLAVMLTGGWDLVGWFIKNGHWPPHSTHIDWWTDLLIQLPNTVSQLFWTPQHFLAAWIGTPMALRFLEQKKAYSLTLLCIALPLWSPFIAAGLVPFVIFGLVKHKWQVNGKHVILSVVLIFFALFWWAYLGATASGLNLIFAKNLFSEGRWRTYLLMQGLEVWIFAAFAMWTLGRGRQIGLLWLAVAVLFVVPLWRSVTWNDWGMRATMPALVVLSAVFLKELTFARRPWARAVGLVLLLVSGLSGIGEFQRAVINLSPIPKAAFTSNSMISDCRTSVWYRSQYCGRSNSRLNRIFFKVPLPIGTTRR
jgi:hypothetical protein